MKPTSIIEDRNKALRALHRAIISESRNLGYLTCATIVVYIYGQPAPRFYITPYSARLYINGRKTADSKRKRDMVADLKEAFVRLQRENPYAPKEWLYEKVVEQPAKSFYMSKHRIKEIVFNYSGRNGK